MNTVSELLQRGGPMMLLVLYIAGPALVVAIIQIARPRSWSRWIALALAVAMLALGIAGFVQGRSRLEHGAHLQSGATPAELEEMRAAGMKEALLPLEFGGALAGVCVVAIVIGELRRRRTRG